MNYLKVSQILIGIYFIVGGSEWLYMSFNRNLKMFFDTEALILRLQDRSFRSIIPKSSITHRYSGSTRVILSLAIAILLTGILLVSSAIFDTRFPVWLPTSAALIVHLVFCTSSGFGLEGADQMASIILFSLSVVYLIPEAEPIIQFFITAQLILSYGAAGIAKLFSKYWRSGDAIIMILSTRSAGIGSAYWLKSHAKVSQLICLLVIIFEVAWFSIPLNTTLAISVLCAGLVFHIINSFVMGLNLFLWSFAAAYPWAIHTITTLHR